MILPTTINQLLFFQEDAIGMKDKGTKMFPYTNEVISMRQNVN